MAKKAVIRSKRRFRFGPRTAILLALLLLLIWLIAAILGHRPGGRESKTPEAPNKSQKEDRPATLSTAESRPPTKDEAPRFEIARWLPPRHNSATNEIRTETSVDGAYSKAWAYLRFQLPQEIPLDAARIQVEALHATLPGLHGNRLLRAIRRIEPDVILLQVAAVPGGFWLEVSTSKFAELVGPIKIRPLEVLDLGLLQKPEEQTELSAPAKSNEDDLELTPEYRPLPGQDRPIRFQGEAGIAVGSISRRGPDVALAPRILFGPYRLNLRSAAHDPATEFSRLLVENLAKGSLGSERSGGLDVVRLLDDSGPELKSLAYSRLYLPGDQSLSSLDFQEQPRAKIAFAKLRLPLGFSERLRLIRSAPGRSREDLGYAIDRELLLFNEENFGLDPSDSRYRIWPFLPGKYEVIDLAAVGTDGKQIVDRIELKPLEMTTYSPPILPALRKLRVRVLDDLNGESIAGAAIGFSLTASLMDWLPSQQISDKDGYFEARGLPRQALQVVAAAEGYLLLSQGIAQDSEEEIELRLRPGPELRVRLVDPQKRAVVTDGFLALGRQGAAIKVPVSQDGVAQFPQLSPDRYILLPVIGEALTQLDDWNWLEKESGGLLVDHPADSREALEFRMPPLKKVILDLTTRGIEGVFDLHIVPAENLPAPGLWPRFHWEGLRAGRLVIAGLPPGRYRAVASQRVRSALADFEVGDAGPDSFNLVLDFN